MIVPVIVNPGMLPLPGGRSSLLKALERVTDPRARRGIRHSIASTLAMVVAAGLSGAGRSFRSVGDLAADLPQDALARLGARFHPVRRRYIAPNEATIRRHVQMIDADEADAAVGGWLAAQGRLDDTFVYGELRVHPHLFRSALGQRRNILEYQVRQTSRGAAITICCRGPVNLQVLERELAAGLERLGLPSPEVSVTAAERLEKGVTGKLKRFVPLRPALLGAGRGASAPRPRTAAR